MLFQDPDAPFPHVYGAIGWMEVKWIVSIGAVFALCTSLLGAMFPLPRILYAMAEDGVLYKILHRVHPWTKTPLISTILSGLLAAIMALIFNLHQLVDMMSIGTLLAYTIVAICVVVLRYQVEPDSTDKEAEMSGSHVLRQLVNADFHTQPTRLSSNITNIAVVLFCTFTVILCVLLSMFNAATYVWITLLSLTLIALILLIVIIARQPSNEPDLTFKVPFVPLLPCLSILINLYLMAQLDVHTWIRFVVWIIIGYVIYFTYGIRNSAEGLLSQQKNTQHMSGDGPPMVHSMHSLQSINMDFVNGSNLALTDTNMKNSHF